VLNRIVIVCYSSSTLRVIPRMGWIRLPFARTHVADCLIKSSPTRGGGRNRGQPVTVQTATLVETLTQSLLLDLYLRKADYKNNNENHQDGEEP
jgi:hypothetical protein